MTTMTPEYNKKYYENNKEKFKEYHINYYKNNKEKIKLRQKKWNEENPEKRKKWNEENPEKLRESRRKHYVKNKEALGVAHKLRWKKLYHTNPNFKLRCNLSARVSMELKKHILKKTQSTLLYVGCSMKQLKEYLENKFEDGMTWDNWSKHGWHIDHIIPCSSFDLTKENEQKKCFHYTNLQPLWAKDNLKKSNKLDWAKECA